MNKIPTLLLIVFLLNTSCNNDRPAPADSAPPPAPATGTGEKQDTVASVSEDQAPESLQEEEAPPPLSTRDNATTKGAASARPPARTGEATPVAKSGYDDVAALHRSIRLDIRYATDNNFTKDKI